MALLKYKDSDGNWIDIYDHKLCKYLNLSELTNKQDARDNLELDQNYLNRNVLKYGLEIDVIDHKCIIQDVTARFVSDRQIEYWNKKIDPPIINNIEPTGNGVQEGSIWYNSSTDNKYIMINGKFREFDNYKYSCGIANFSGDNLETIIAHGCADSSGNPVVPKSYFATCTSNPQGYLGEMWIRADANNLYVGNTGTYTGEMKWTALY